MKEKKFKYQKKNGDMGEYNLLILNEDSTHIKGIDYNKLSKEEAEQVKQIQQHYEKLLQPFMKGYRQFIKENIITEEENKE